ncbi:MAG: class I SAM-dependent methyltransferase [Rhodospirillales bacterium]|nr:class I SAM-dependent methyltransferase [Rhodospirillales bacterium]
MRLLSLLFQRVFRIGRLTVIDATGKSQIFGEGEKPALTIRVHDDATARRIFFNPRLAIGEAYMDGRLTIENGDIYDFLDFCAINLQHLEQRGLTFDFGYRLQLLFRRFQQFNPISRAQRNVAHHYDLSGTLYDLFLDNDRQYSCAYFTTDNDSLEVAQDNKKRHIAAKLLLKPGARVLDIGSGWGGLGIYLAKVGAGEVLGVTLSSEQHKVSNQRAAAAGLDGQVRFDLRDYRQQTGTFDRIVSVGMFEHVGVNHYREFFEHLKSLLAEDGVALLHSIGRSDGPGTTNSWIRKYIFPGGYSPALSEVLPAVEKAGLWVTDIEILRLHYADTLKEWRRRFQQARDEVRNLYDERFCRMWEFYLAGSEIAFRRQGHMVFQMQIAKSVNAVPLTRDYIQEWERANAGRANLAV